MRDPVKKLTALEWEPRAREIPDEFRSSCRSLRSMVPGGVEYLFTPWEYSCRGDLLLRRLRFDSSPEALRLWAFLFSEKDRLFLAKNAGAKIIALMKDLGQTAILSYAFPGQLSFYADELWWAPCFAESTHLLDHASDLGATDELCFVRAVLGAMKTLDYFPRPDLCVAGVGACCDDFSAVMQLVEGIGIPVHWWEMTTPIKGGSGCVTPFGGVPYSARDLAFLRGQLGGVVRALGETLGMRCTGEMLRGSVNRLNRLRALVRNLREMVYGADYPPLPGLEMYLAEFIAIHTCSEPDECFPVLAGLHRVAEERLSAGLSPLAGEKEPPLRVYWVYPPTDASLITLLEDLGGCVAGTDYFINHAFLPLRTATDPLTAVAENCFDDRLLCSPSRRADEIIRDVRHFRAEGVLVSGIFGASHCPWDDRVIQEKVQKELGLPVMVFDVPYSPGRVSEQVRSRMEAFMEIVRHHREKKR